MFGAKVFKYLLKIPALIFIVAFVVLNRQETELYISPLSDPLTLPLWLLGIILFALGFLVGALLLWLNHWPERKQNRTLKKDLKQTQDKYEELVVLRNEGDTSVVVVDEKPQ